MSKVQESSLDKLREAAEVVRKSAKALEGATRKRDDWITRCVAAGVKPAEVARVAGVSRGRVSQIAPVPKPDQPRVYAGKKGAPGLRVNDPATVPVIPDTPSMFSGVASTRSRQRYGKATVFRAPAPIAALLAEVPAGLDTCRIYVTGGRPVDPASDASIAEQVRAWALGNPGEEWEAASHYLADPDLPVLRFKHRATGQAVTVMRAAAWWGETDADVATCEAAWSGLEKAIDAVPAFAGAGLADTPATTGRALWLRTIPAGKSYPVLSDEIRELIAATSGQGRIELRPAPVGADGYTSEFTEDFTYLDGRFMYAALTWGMPVGEPVRWTGEAIDKADAATFTKAVRGRSRWRITCKVPAGWNHVGLFMVPDDGERRGSWHYPNQPGQTFTTWADGSEVWAAMEAGWEPTFLEGLTWAEGKPLDTWHDALVGVWERATAAGSPAAALAAKAVRSMLLFTIGAFAARQHPVTRTTTDPAEVPAGVEVRRVGESLVWTETPKPSGWSAQVAHPEWSATVWARARTRLLTAKGVDGEPVGALHLPPERVVAFATDALYLAGGSPGWADDGKPGRFRSKGTRPGAFDWPETPADLYKLRDEAEAAR